MQISLPERHSQLLLLQDSLLKLKDYKVSRCSNNNNNRLAHNDNTCYTLAYSNNTFFNFRPNELIKIVIIAQVETMFSIIDASHYRFSDTYYGASRR